MENLIELSINQIQEVEIEILTEIDKICKENNLSYSLAAGTVIGAVRHKGFIPWDDDIDILMLRKDYEKLKEIMTSHEYKNIKYLSCETQEDYWWPYAKVVSLRTEAKEKNTRPTKDYGVFVDIFPIDNLPNDETERNKYIKNLQMLRSIYILKLFNKQIANNKIKLLVKKFLTFFLKPVSLRSTLLKFNNLAKKYKDTPNCNTISCVVTDVISKKKLVYPHDFFDKKKYAQFENTQFMLMENYDEYLKELYGDYMKLPPKEQQVSDHHWEILKWKK